MHPPPSWWRGRKEGGGVKNFRKNLAGGRIGNFNFGGGGGGEGRGGVT